KGIPIIPVRIQDIMPTDSLESFLSTPHWLDGFRPPLDQYFQQLTKAVATLIGGQSASQQPDGIPQAVSAPARPAMVVTPRPPSLLPLVAGPELLSKCRDETVLAKLNELLKQRGYHWISIKADEATFGHSAAGE